MIQRKGDKEKLKRREKKIEWECEKKSDIVKEILWERDNEGQSKGYN